MPGNNPNVLDGIDRPYKTKYIRGRCKHPNTVNVNLGYDFVTDMLVLEFALDDSRIDTHRKDNPWLSRAAQSLAAALRLTASKELDIEFTELVTGYRLRNNSKGSFVDIYLYDSLSSGAGYAVGVSDEIENLIGKIEQLLTDCDCSGACHNCLKHYRNQYVHGMLDRFAALDLLHWGVNGNIAKAIPIEEQKNLIKPLENILEESGCSISFTKNDIVVNQFGNAKHLVVYPAMWVEPHRSGTIFVSDAFIKYAKPYAVQKIIAEAGNASPNMFEQETVERVVSNVQADASWQNQLTIIDPDAQDMVDKMIAAGIPAPDVVGFELTGSKGMTIGEAELAWLEEKIVYLTPTQEDYKEEFVSKHWTVITDESNISRTIFERR